MNRPVKILAIDGGGIRGLYTATLLDAVKEFYARMAKRKSAASVSEPSSISSSPPSEGGGYVSSVHSGGAGPPDPKPSAADHVDMSPWTPQWMDAVPEDSLTELTHKQYQHRRWRKELDEFLGRLQSRLKGA